MVHPNSNPNVDPTPQVGPRRLEKERCFCVDRHDDRGCGCPTHVQLSYLLKGLQLWRKAGHYNARPPCSCTCRHCRDSHQVAKSQIADCSAFADAIHSSEFCRKSERGCRPLLCALGFCEHCADYEDAIKFCTDDFSSKRLVRYKTIEPVSSGGKVYDDWVYKELELRPFLRLLQDFYTDKYRCLLMLLTHTTLLHSVASCPTHRCLQVAQLDI